MTRRRRLTSEFVLAAIASDRILIAVLLVLQARTVVVAVAAFRRIDAYIVQCAFELIG
jgi:hypothetical protein